MCSGILPSFASFNLHVISQKRYRQKKLSNASNFVRKSCAKLEPWRTVTNCYSSINWWRCRNQSDSTLHMVQRSLGTFPRPIFSEAWIGEREAQNKFWSVSLKIIKKYSLKLFQWPCNKTTLTCSVFATKWSIFSNFCWVNHTAVSSCFHRGPLGNFNSCMARQ